MAGGVAWAQRDVEPRALAVVVRQEEDAGHARVGVTDAALVVLALSRAPRPEALS